MSNWEQIRANYKLLNKGVYMNTAWLGSMSNATISVQMDCLAHWQSEGNKVLAKSNQAADFLRREFLQLLNANNHQSAVVTDVSTAMNHIAEKLTGKRIALLDEDFPSVNMPWIGRDFDIRWIVKQDLTYEIEDIEKALEDGVEVLAVSWVMYNSGLMLDLDRLSQLCKKHDVIFIVDATQGLVANHLDLEQVDVDVLLFACFKWFLSGYGTCGVICKDEFIEKYPVVVAGHNTIIDGQASIKDPANHRRGVARFELGHIKVQQILALETSFKELKKIGFSNIQKRTHGLMSSLVDDLAAIGVEVLTPAPRSANIVVIEATPMRVKKLDEKGIVYTQRHGLIRFGLYFYNNEKDIKQLIEALK